VVAIILALAGLVFAYIASWAVYEDKKRPGKGPK